MKVEASVTINEEKIRKAMIEQAEQVQQQELDNQLRIQFQRAGYGVKLGIGRELIANRVEAIFEELWDSDAFTRRLDERVRAKFNEYVEEAIDVAAKHKARKLAFHHVNEALKDADRND